jgi:hypothetical protein
MKWNCKWWTFSNVRFGWEIPRIFLKIKHTINIKIDIFLYSHLSVAGLLVDSFVLVTSSSELFRFLQTIGIARAHEPSQIKLKFSFHFFFLKTKSHLAKVRSSSPIFSLSFAICRRRASNLHTHLILFIIIELFSYLVQNWITHSSKCSSTKPLSE